MNKSKSLKTLAVVFFLSGLWDVFAAIVYSFMIGTGGSFDNPPFHRFYAIFIASFLYCFAYLQILSAFNIKRYLLNIGCVFIGRIFYVILLYAYIFGIEGFPKTSWWTGMGDLLWSVLYIVITLTSAEIHLKDLSPPQGRKLIGLRSIYFSNRMRLVKLRSRVEIVVSFRRLIKPISNLLEKVMKWSLQKTPI